MKFVCDSCQAKYQIGDEKVAGKTVRMKCRRCGHEIRVRAGSAPDAGGTSPIDPPSAEIEAPMPVSLSSGSIAAAAPSAPGVASGPRPIAPVPPASGPGMIPQRTPIGVIAPRALAPQRAPIGAPAGSPAPAASHAAPPRPAHAAPPRPAGAVASAPRPLGAPRPLSAPSPVRPVTRASGASSAAIAAAHPAVEEAPHAPPASAPARSTWGEVDDESTALFSMAHAPRPADPGPAFSPGPPPVAAAPMETGDADWYVGIAGTPLGPVHAAIIRDRALAGEVDSESLVWREGLAEWRPLKTFPELVQMVADAQQAAYAALYAVPAPAPSVPIALVTMAAPSPAPHGAPSAAPRSAFGDPYSSAASSAGSPAASPAAPSAQNGKSNGYHAAHLQPAAPVPDDAPVAPPAAALVSGLDAPAAQPLAPGPGPKVAAESDLDLVLGRKRGGTHPMAYAFIAAAAVFGGVAAYVLLSKPQTQIVVVQQAASVTGTAAASGAPAMDTAQVEVGDISAANPQGTVPRLGGSMPRPKGSATATSSTPIDTSGFNNSVPGPAATGPSGSQQGGGGQLSQGEIGAVVSQNQPLVKRKCWQPALEARPPNGPTNARVNGSITIGASGQVETANASGGERDFPGLSSCIAARMKNWKFPPSGGPTSVNVPFVFAGQ